MNTRPIYVDALVRFAVEIPTEDADADVRADEISDALTAAVNGLGLGIYDDSASVIDWTQREESEVLGA